VYEKNNIVFWEPEEVIYRVDDAPDSAYLITDGAIVLYTREGLQLNRMGQNEILGETSLLLGIKRTVTAIAGKGGAQAKRIPPQYFNDLLTRDKVIAALIRKVQYRLIDSNIQSNSLAVNLERITELVEMHTDGLNMDDSTVAELKKLLSDVRQKVVFTRDIIAYPPAPDEAASNYVKSNATDSSVGDLG